MKPKKKVRIGDLLVENKIISQAQLESALADQKKSGRKLGRVLIDNGYIEERSLLDFLSRQLNIPYVNLRARTLDPEVTRILPEMHARRFRALAIGRRDGVLEVGMADPTDIFAYDELARTLRQPFEAAVVSETDLLQIFDQVYRKTEAIEGFAEELQTELSERDVDRVDLAGIDSVADAPVVKLLHSLFEDAVQIGASDIHIEPDEKVLRIRQRVDGMLQEQVMDEKRIAPALVLRLKLMAGLDISEKRLPQDGRFSVTARNKPIDVRLSTMPVQHGESVVMRLLDQSAGLYSLDDLGMGNAIRHDFERAIRRPHGMVLVTGPTGSGKTTTLYSALNALNEPRSKIITVEDPVEYRLPRINQVQVNTDIGLTFARVLRTVLRQDPDIVLVGEMRDEETVEIGLRAALTGHLVLSTLHTNDAASTVSRLLDMGAKGYLLGSALKAVVAQRLVRRVCDDCAEPRAPNPAEAAWLGARGGDGRVDLRAGRGCHRCNGTGYRGRIGVHELLELDDDMQLALSDDDGLEFGRAAERSLRGCGLVDAALELALTGQTGLDEVTRLVGDGTPEPAVPPGGSSGRADGARALN